jgi:hypothetical protein
MDALLGDEVCARPATGSLVVNAGEANLLRRLLSDEVGRCLRAGRVDEAAVAFVVSKRAGELELGIRYMEREIPAVADECLAWLDARRAEVGR